MIGPRYWSTGIVVWRVDENRWGARVDFYDDGFCQSGSTEGSLRTRERSPLSQVVDLAKADAERLGIHWATALGAIPTVFYDGNVGLPPPPPNWRALVNSEAERLGWVPGYDAGAAP